MDYAKRPRASGSRREPLTHFKTAQTTTWGRRLRPQEGRLLSGCVHLISARRGEHGRHSAWASIGIWERCGPPCPTIWEGRGPPCPTVWSHEVFVYSETPSPACAVLKGRALSRPPCLCELLRQVSCWNGSSIPRHGPFPMAKSLFKMTSKHRSRPAEREFRQA